MKFTKREDRIASASLCACALNHKPKHLRASCMRYIPCTNVTQKQCARYPDTAANQVTFHNNWSFTNSKIHLCFGADDMLDAPIGESLEVERISMLDNSFKQKPFAWKAHNIYTLNGQGHFECEA